MKSSIIALVFVVVVLISYTGKGIAGSASSGGGDAGDVARAWFASDHPIKYCVDISPSFGISAGQFDSELTTAIQAWSDYLSSNNDGSLRANLNYQKIPKCGTTEDLAFYLGVENPTVVEGKKEFNFPLSFARRVSYDIGQGWGKGFIWVARSNSPDSSGAFQVPNWARPGFLQAVLRHELGHVMGCGHVDGTIMDSNNSNSLLFADTDERAAYLAKIDHNRKLFASLWKSYEYVGRIGKVHGQVDSSLYKQFFGTMPQGSVTAALKIGAAVRSDSGALSFDGALSVKDGDKTISLKITFPGIGVHYKLGEIFNSVGPHWEWISDESTIGRASTGEITRSDGKKTGVQFFLNAEDGYESPAELYYFQGGDQLPLFITDVDNGWH